MADLLSPGISKNEVNLTGIIPSVSSSIGAIAGVYNWGPVDQIKLVSSEQELVSRYGKPSNRNAETWFAGANFLAYGNKLYVSRGANTTSANGTISAIANVGTISANVIASTVKNNVDYEAKDGTFDTNIVYIAKFPGENGNSLRVSQCDTANGFSSTIGLSTANVTGALEISVGANTATVSFSPVGNNTISTANTLATSVLSGLSVGDYITVGNTTIGTQSVKISSLPTVVSSNSTVASFSVNLSTAYRLRTATASNTINRSWEFSSLVGKAPGTSGYVSKFGNTSAVDEIHVVVVDEGGAFTGVPGTVLETHKGLSRASDAKGENNSSIFVKDVLNGSSEYVWVANPRSGADFTTATNISTASAFSSGSNLNLRFNNGQDGYSESDVNSLSATYAAYEKYSSSEEITIDLVITGKSIGGINGEQLSNFIVDNVVSTRQDCVLFVSPSYSTVINNRGNELNSLISFEGLLRDSSYRFLDTGYKYQEDRYNGVYRWIPLNGDIAGLAARTDQIKDPWWSFAGPNRGQIKNCIKLAWSPSAPERDILYPANINPVVTFAGEGTYLWGDKTGENKASAFDRINVRRLFIILERAISKAAKYSLFEINDEFTRASFKNMVVPYLRTIQGRRGITDFLVICDSTNNTGEVIDRNEFIADIYIKPARSINFIKLNFVAVGTSVSFNTVVGNW